MYLGIVALPVVLAVLVLIGLGIALAIGRVDALRRKRKADQAAEARISEEMSWVDAVDRIVGIAELMKDKR